MKIFSRFEKERKVEKNQIALHGGSYSLVMTALVLAIMIVLNILVSALPAAMTRFDISSSKLYSITSNTKVVVNALEKDVTIYWIVQSGEEDDVIENLLNKYESLSDHLTVVKKNPDIYPAFAQQYTSETVMNNSLVVECGDKSRYIGYDDIYLAEANMYSHSYDSSFDGEGAITSAIDYVISEELPQLYVLEGHGEAELPEMFSEQIQKENIELNTFSLLTADGVPKEADAVLIYAPSSDISKEEKEMLADYAENGGKLLVMAGPAEDDSLENLYSLLADYGVEASEGIVVDPDREHYAFQAPYVLLPDIANTEITSPLIEENYYAIIPIAQGLTISNSSNAEALLTTSEASFSKIDGYALDTYEKEEGDIDGPFTVGVSIECLSGGQIIWFSSSEFLNDMYNAYSSGANLDLSMNAVSTLIGETEAVAIRSKSLNYNYLTISDSVSSILKVVMIGAFPLIYLFIGFAVIFVRRRENEAV